MTEVDWFKWGVFLFVPANMIFWLMVNDFHHNYSLSRVNFKNLYSKKAVLPILATAVTLSGVVMVCVGLWALDAVKVKSQLIASYTPIYKK